MNKKIKNVGNKLLGLICVFNAPILISILISLIILIISEPIAIPLSVVLFLISIIIFAHDLAECLFHDFKFNKIVEDKDMCFGIIKFYNWLTED